MTLVVHHGEVIFCQASGWADRKAHKPMRKDTIVRFASITKSIMTAVMMRLVEQSVLALDQPVARWLPAFQPRLPDGRAPDITLHHLLTHTSGRATVFSNRPKVLATG